MTQSIMAHVMILLIMSYNKMTHSEMAFRTMKLNITILGIKTLSTMTLSTMTLSIMTLSIVTLSITEKGVHLLKFPGFGANPGSFNLFWFIFSPFTAKLQHLSHSAYLKK